MAKIALQKDKNESQNGPSQFFFQEAKNSWVLFHPLQIFNFPLLVSDTVAARQL